MMTLSLRLAGLMVAGLMAASAASAADDGTDPELTRIIGGHDEAVFAAYNRCDLAAFGAYFAPKVEFYHDKGGVTWDRASVVANTRKWICGKVRRELVPGTLRVYPIKDYGAIEEGEHRFCSIAGNQCEGAARFLMIWRRQGTAWVMTRVISYGHRPLLEP